MGWAPGTPQREGAGLMLWGTATRRRPMATATNWPARWGTVCPLAPQRGGDAEGQDNGRDNTTQPGMRL